MKTVSKLSVQLCRDNPKNMYVFGDNLIGKGKAGQACIRDEPNAFGIPTKRLPSMASDAFFSGLLDESLAVFRAIDKLQKYQKYDGYTIVFPSAGMGTGLAKMKQHSPKLFKDMNEELIRVFGE